MKHKIVFLTIILSSTFLQAQRNIDGLAKAERSFAAFAVSHGTKPAFLQFADSNGVMFDEGKAVNAVAYWNARDERQGILNWRPDYVEIAASHDFGFTTGPWTFQPKSLDDSITARGRFITVWQVTKKGEWKFLVDIGVNNTPALSDTILRKIEITDPSVEPGDTSSLMEAEKKFITDAGRSLKAAYSNSLSARTLITRNAMAPGKTDEEIITIVGKSPQSIQYNPINSGIASSGDLGYVYGTTMIEGKTENYLHIWRKEKEGWKIALEVLRL
jgi:ketosteroid isomerase-like protein